MYPDKVKIWLVPAISLSPFFVPIPTSGPPHSLQYEEMQSTYGARGPHFPNHAPGHSGSHGKLSKPCRIVSFLDKNVEITQHLPDTKQTPNSRKFTVLTLDLTISFQWGHFLMKVGFLWFCCDKRQVVHKNLTWNRKRRWQCPRFEKLCRAQQVPHPVSR